MIKEKMVVVLLARMTRVALRGLRVGVIMGDIFVGSCGRQSTGDEFLVVNGCLLFTARAFRRPPRH